MTRGALEIYKENSSVTFMKGQSGNPRGKPKGARDKRTALRVLLEPHSESLVQKTVQLALGGDTTALRLCLERLIPPVKSKDEPGASRPQADGSSRTRFERAFKRVR